MLALSCHVGPDEATHCYVADFLLTLGQTKMTTCLHHSAQASTTRSAWLVHILYGLISSNDWHLSWGQECCCVPYIVHHVSPCSNRVCLISKKRQHCYSAWLLFLDAWWDDQVIFTAPATYSVTLTSNHSYSSVNSGLGNSVPPWTVHQGGREMYYAQGIFSELITWITVSGMLLQMLGTLTLGWEVILKW